LKTRPATGASFATKKDFSTASSSKKTLPTKKENQGNQFRDLLFRHAKLFAALSRVQNDNAQGEYYLTDVPALLREAKAKTSRFIITSDAREVSGINNRAELADWNAFCAPHHQKMMLDYGVTFIDPKNAYISEQASIGRDTIIYPNVSIEGASVIGDGCTIRAGTRITNSRVGRGVEILDNCVITDSEISDNAPSDRSPICAGKAKMEESAKVGNFVELKKTILGRGSKASHLTYLGDATIGEKTNIGAGTITCNYDGKINTRRLSATTCESARTRCSSRPSKSATAR
jgi:bifunctional UDP-N-acetylglucosamine pyrophosphorylase/glucosamine-1-phosphate N-acetyltransferase